jgi:hypothetical protein
MGVPQDLYDGLLASDSRAAYMRDWVTDMYPTALARDRGRQ